MNRPEVYAVSNIESFAKLANKMDVAEEVAVYYGKNKADAKKTEDFYGVYNTSKKELAKVMGSTYAIVQHKDVVSALAAALGEKGLEVQGTVRNFGNFVMGDLIFMNGKVPIHDDSGEGVRLGVRFTNSYNGTSAFRLSFFGYRLVCSNGMVLGRVLRDVSVTTFHRGRENQKNFTEIVYSTKRFVERVIDASSALQKYIDESIKDMVAIEVIGPTIGHLFSSKKHRDAILKELKIDVIEKKEKKKPVVVTYIPQKDAPKKMSRYDIYNAITAHASGEKIALGAELFSQEVAQRVLTEKFEKLIIASA
jgi:hypothetical protein